MSNINDFIVDNSDVLGDFRLVKICPPTKSDNVTDEIVNLVLNPDHTVQVFFRGLKNDIDNAKAMLKEAGGNCFGLITELDVRKTRFDGICELFAEGDSNLIYEVTTVLNNYPCLKCYYTIEGIDEDFYLVATADSGQGYISRWHWESYEEVVSDNVLQWWKSFDYKIIKDNEYYALERIKSSKS